jgi:TonB family protein
METSSFGNGWEGRVVEGQLPLLEWLGSIGNCSSYLTLLQGSQEAVIHLIRTDSAEADIYIAQWNFAMGLSHPHLTQVFAAGRCVMDRSDLVYVVTERPYSTLSKIIRGGTLKAELAGEIFKPVLDALSYLHRNGVVHGYISPSNILLADLKPKLSATNFLKAGSAARSVAECGKYDAPELQRGEISAAADAWSVGMTLYESMTRALPSWDPTVDEEPVVTDALPDPFREIVQDCLRVDPVQRCTIPTMVERLDASNGRFGESKSIALSSGSIPVEMDRTPSAAAATIPTREILAVEEPSLFSTTEEIDDEEAPVLFSRSFANIEETHATRFWVMLSVVVVLAGIVASALWVREHKNEAPPAVASQRAPAVSEPAPQEPSATPAPPAANPTEPESSPPGSKAETDETPQAETQAAPSQPAPQPPPAADHAPAKENSEGLVAKRVLPTVSPGARRGMRRPLEVIVRVTVNQDGAVSNAAFVSPGSGNYFARLAQKAALSWEFTPPRRSGNPVRSVWTLRFHFEREKTEVMAVEESR